MGGARKAFRFASVGHAWFEAPAGDLPAPAPCLLAVHGYGQPIAPWRAYARAVAPSAVTVVPEGPSAFYRRSRRPADDADAVGHGWIAKLPREPFDARNDALLAAALAEALDDADADPSRVFVMGFSQGVGVALHFALSHPDRVAGVVGLAGGLAQPYRPRLEALASKPVLWITGAKDTAYPPAYTEAMLAAMTGAGLEVEAHTLDTGHDLQAPAEGRVRTWLEARFAEA